eukprot:GHVS01054511.1.p1 GENE.GHVS01054511.1~~GHVS01054511.1.p1  ORF type:complete len:462 (+),score=32.75 GHVS01054511.1:155-1387(+)
MCQMKCLSYRQAHWFHMFIFFWIYILSLLSELLIHKSPLFIRSTSLKHCLIPSSLDSSQRCISQQVIYRYGFVSSSVFLLLALSCANLRTCKFAHERLAPLKCVFPVLGFVGFLFAPNYFFVVFGYLSQLLALPFMCVQSVYVLAFGYAWNDSWFSRAMQHEGRMRMAWLGAILTASAVLVGLTVTMAVYIFSFAGLPSFHLWLTSVVLAGGILSTLFSISPWANHSGLLPSAVALTLSVYFMAVAPLGFSANSSAVDIYNKFALPIYLHLLLQMSMFLLAVIYRYKCLHNTTALLPVLTDVGGCDELTATLSDSSTDNNRQQQVVDIWDTSNVLQLDLLFLFASLYISPLMTRWATPMAADGTPNVAYLWPAVVGDLPYAYTTTFGLLAALTYAWSLAAPLLLPDREFY